MPVTTQASPDVRSIADACAPGNPGGLPLLDLIFAAGGAADALPMAVVGLDASFAIVGWSETAERIFGWRAEEAHGRYFLDLLVPPSRRAGGTAGGGKALFAGRAPPD